MIINSGDPIDGDSINEVYEKIETVKDKLIHLIWRNDLNDNKVVKSMDGKPLQVLAGVVDIKDRTTNKNEISVKIRFPNAFSGKQPVVTCTVQSSAAYGYSITEVSKEGFTVVIHQFGDDNNIFNIRAINYIAVGQP